MKFSGWGRYPVSDSLCFEPSSIPDAIAGLQTRAGWTPRGLGRSYGDSALGAHLLTSRYLDHFLDFNEDTGVLTCSAGTSLDDILKIFIPRGWFLPVTPGTRFVSVGGAIAADVHGKNHHLSGSFTDHVVWIDILLGNGEILRTSRDEHGALFDATCGGMGLTGFILAAAFRMMPITSGLIDETVIRAPNLAQVLDAFDEHHSAPYSVAWIDGLAQGPHLGRSLLMLGRHAPHGLLEYTSKPALNLAFDLPSRMLNKLSVGAFNGLYYSMADSAPRQRQIPLEAFFYPLDKISNWNRLYGKPGFIQYQFVLPRHSGKPGLEAILRRIAASGAASFLAVLKALGKGNGHPLSFPMEGYTLAMDFKAEAKVFELLDELDPMVLDFGGRHYLAKDARMARTCLERAYPRLPEFRDIRQRYHACGKFTSMQAERLGLV